MPFLKFKKVFVWLALVSLLAPFSQPVVALASSAKEPEAKPIQSDETTLDLPASPDEPLIDPAVANTPGFDNWWATAQKEVEGQEYQPTQQTKDNIGEDLPENSWHFVNRAQNLRSYITTRGWRVSPREVNVGDSWSWLYTSLGIARDDFTEQFSPAVAEDISSKDDTVFIDRGNIQEWYKNSSAGIEQGYTIKEKPTGAGQLKLTAQIETDLSVSSFNHEQITFSTNKKDVLKLDHLLVYDARQQKIPAQFVYNQHDSILMIVVDDQNAVYPLTIDPLNATPDWTAEANQINAYFGQSVASAGDVNNDGYDDVIIGAYKYDNGQADEGRAFVYYGSASGLSATADWTAESDQIDAYFGGSVASAGDVNHDGYSDVIIGAYQYDNGQSNEGGAFVYYGSASGLSATADWTAESNQASAYFGSSVASAGDVNHDSYSDVIIGAHLYDNGQADEGAAFVYYGSASGLSAVANWTAESNQASAYFGYSVASAGDVNHDSYSDVIVGAYYYDGGQADEGRAYVYHGSASGLSAVASWTAESNQVSAYFGYSVASAGDVNNDSYSDVIIGAYYYDNGQSNEGQVSVYHGSASGLSAVADWTVESDQANAYFGNSVASAGDINNDGYDDVLVGAYKYDGGLTDEGRAYLYLGSTTGLSTIADWLGESDQGYAYFGYSVASAGDINNDGYSDVLMSAYYYDNGQTDEGQAYLYYGSASGLSAAVDWTAESDQVSAAYGVSVASAGDVNGDGYDDVIVGSHYYDNGQTDEGRVFVYYGSASGLSATADWTAESDQATAYYGTSVSSAGDINHDGYSDVIVGAYKYDNGQTDEGRAFVYYGSASGLSATADWTAESDQTEAYFGISVASAGDVNNDDYDDVIVGASFYNNGEADEGKAYVYYGSASGLSATADWTAESNQASAYMGVSVASAGDVNNDGYSDVIIGAHLYDNGQTNEGRVFVYHGSASGLSLSADWLAEPDKNYAWFGNSVASAGDVNNDGYSDVIIGAPTYSGTAGDESGRVHVYYGSVSGLSATADWAMEPSRSYNNFGQSVSSAGDVNGDGYDDVIIGAYKYDNGESDEGRAFAYYGSALGLSTTTDWVVEPNQTSAYFGYSVASAGDVNNDGYSDVIIGAYQYSNGESTEGRAFAYYGSGVSYTISYDANSSTSGSVPANQTKSYGLDLTLRSNTGSLAKTGYTFSGWNTSTDGSGTHYAEGATFTTNANTTLYAEWTLNTYTISYDANSSTSGSVPANQTKSYGLDLTLRSNTGSLAKTGYTFSGWNSSTDGSGTHYAEGATFTTNANTTLYAEWTAEAVVEDNSNSNTASGSGYIPPASIGGGQIDLSIPMGESKNIGHLESKGTNILGYIGSTANFSVIVSNSRSTQNHQLTIIHLDLILKKIKVEIKSDPVILELVIGEDQHLDLDGDQTSDLVVAYNSLLVNRVDLTIRQLAFDGPGASEIIYSENSLLKEPGKSAVYLIQAGQKRPFFNGAAFLAGGYRWANIQTVGDLSLIPTGVTIYALADQSDNYQFQRNLKSGMTGPDVKELQKYLNLNGFQLADVGPGSPGQETDYFGALTLVAVQKFQLKHQVVRSAQDSGFGLVGPATRAKLMELFKK